MHAKLEEVLHTMEFYQKTYPEDACLVLADNEKVIAYRPGSTIDLKIPIGASVQHFEGTVTEMALNRREGVREERGPERFGVAYIASATPIFSENDEIIGVLSAIVSNQRLDNMRKCASELLPLVEELSASSETLAHGAQIVAEKMQTASGTSTQMSKEIEKVEKISGFVADVASQSKILGLNASIEASSVGESGKGFSIIAREIRKMAEDTKRASVDIDKELRHLMNGIRQLSDGSSMIAATSQQHAASVQEMKAIYDQITAIAEELLKISQVQQ